MVVDGCGNRTAYLSVARKQKKKDKYPFTDTPPITHFQPGPHPSMKCLAS